jgi:hypothetical protein
MAAILTMLAGCATTTRIDDAEFSVRRLKAERLGIALLRVGAASPKCLHVAVLLGVRSGEAYRRVRVLAVANVRSIAIAPVAEAELDAGEYHIVGYSCTNDKGSKVVSGDTGPGSPYYTSSYARFTIQPGEVVNLGYLHFAAASHGESVFGRPIKSDVTVSDWPLEEIERFQRQRPHLFAEMRTRLMETGEPPLTPAEQAEACRTWRVLVAEGKASGPPKTCR